jgi:hypothetical protein
MCVHHVVRSLSGDVTITTTGDVVWLRVFFNDMTIQGGSLTLVGGGSSMLRSFCPRGGARTSAALKVAHLAM